jgi:hypothetical protein
MSGKMKPIMEPIKKYARKRGMYPYRRPKNSYLLIGDERCLIYPLESDPNIFEAPFEYRGKNKKLDNILSERKVIESGERVPVIGYGSMPNPNILIKKFREFRKNSNIEVSYVLPVIKGSIKGYDTVYAAYFSKFESIPAHIVNSDETEIEAWLTLLDENQLVAMHESEGLPNGSYQLGLIDFIFENGYAIQSYVYIGSKRSYIDIGKNEPVALASKRYKGINNKLVAERDFIPINVKKRKFRVQRTQKEMMKIFRKNLRKKYPGKRFYERYGVLSEWARDNRNFINSKIEGRVLDVGVKGVEEPYKFESLKKLEGLI